ncbi:2-amino-4-hydroxy-6-hydroxymethyldihydropteridine diphosphokinase [Bdellovibrio svalbardensis]|uniref:2-amino-4-hydroxy-6-hydroxymethyldihydropteridine diphosphokinase n=1 Tax=Bdellovibrio svalbardensis TaxID=2972972 RepID=A0ABT6DDG0_9BACT|nr:hypothetical protein [Bdellovibrio svalbardensis]MDG0814875.1 2-amino-4-hydroxy-6-hydroxymethyldihydropteridine diphosphokinase [Bdellovibrio svalbardensis]
MNQPHNALIFVALDLVGGDAKAKDLLAKILECGEIVSISSVYKRYLTDARVDLNARMEFVIRFETVMSVDQCLHMVLSMCEQGSQGLSQKSHAELILLSYDNAILMSPRLTLPYPEMHTDPLIIRCAAEAWGQYEHPIFQKTLSEISRTAAPARMAEFYIQGKSLVDF